MDYVIHDVVEVLEYKDDVWPSYYGKCGILVDPYDMLMNYDYNYNLVITCPACVLLLACK